MNWDRGSEWEGTDEWCGDGLCWDGLHWDGLCWDGLCWDGLCWDEAYGMVASSCRCIGYIMVLREK